MRLKGKPFDLCNTGAIVENIDPHKMKGLKMKTSELTGTALDWAVTKCETGQPLDMNGPFLVAFKYSTDWAQGGPIIERETCIAMLGRLNSGIWQVQALYDIGQDKPGDYYYGPTPLVAAMRCYVASKLGDEVEIPEELK